MNNFRTSDYSAVMTLNQKYPAKSHAKRTIETYARLFGRDTSFAVYQASAVTELWPHCDQEKPLRQNRYFNYFSGAWDLRDSHVLYVPETHTLTLYIPGLDEDEVMWSGLPLSPKEALEKYDVDNVKLVSELSKDLDSLKCRVVSVEPSKQFPKVDVCPKLQQALDETRMIKDHYEIELLRRAAKISDTCHLAVMKAVPIEKNEGHIHAEFVYHAMRQGSKNQAYDPICCAGTHAGTLHYVRNDGDITKDQLLVLIDAGAEWQAYASDVTRVFPLKGEWTPECRAIYDLVLKMQTETMNCVRPGAKWEDLHMLAHRILVEGLLELGIFQNGSVDEIFESGVSTGFLPHGLGHMLGMDTHDTGGKPNYEDPNPMLRYLRIRRTLEENMYVTVEPGCYFNEFLLKPHLESSSTSKYVNRDVLKRYMCVGGVRIEDDVLVTHDGFENFTKITRDPEEISKIVREALERGGDHFHNLA